MILQTALEAEVTEFLGRTRYRRGDRTREGSRNGHRQVTVKTTAGPVQLERPKLRGTHETFGSRLLGKHVARSNAWSSWRSRAGCGVCRTVTSRRRWPRRSATKAPCYGPPTPRGPSPRALCAEERRRVLEVLHDDRFADAAPAQVWATLLDEGVHLASESTMYRLLRAEGEVCERRAQATHPTRVKPELVADAPNQVWSWDITKLPGPAKRTAYHLYVVLDVYSRYAVGWTVAERETAQLATTLLADSIAKQHVDRDQLTIHADCGTSMASKPVAHLLADLGVTKSHSRPRCSNDNPFSEAQFKTLKYCPAFPDRFGSIQHARAFCRRFFAYYNGVHRHSGIGLLTPSDVHHGRCYELQQARAAVLDKAYRDHPQRCEAVSSA